MDYQMTQRLELELDLITDLSPVELASKVDQAVREAIETVKHSLDAELAFDVFVLLDGHAVCLVMEPV